MGRINKEVAAVLDEKHKKQAQSINAQRAEASPLKVGDLVWYLRPADSGEKVDSRWIGPAAVVECEGERSYVIELKPQFFMKARRSMLKPYVQDSVVGRPTELFVHRRTEPVVDAELGEWNVEEILEHKFVKGQYRFLTKWENSDECTWEPLPNFIPQFSREFVNYCKRHGILQELVRFLTAEWAARSIQVL
jgi:hypothetical protein